MKDFSAEEQTTESNHSNKELIKIIGTPVSATVGKSELLYSLKVYNKENNLTFKTSKDLADNFTEYYDFVYQYITDCLSIDLNYRKTFYSDGNIEPDETLSFLLRIIPFTEFGVPNIGNVINK